MLNGLDLFSGIGGISVALEDYVRTVAYCERDLYAISVLLERMRSGQIENAPICTDVRELRGEDLPEIDIIFGGFPCQDISVAGNGVGLGGERSGLYFHIERLIKETNPRFVFLENVPAIRTRGLSGVAQSLTEIGYDCRWTIVSASAVGAPHKRERWFLLAHTNGEKESLANTKSTGLERHLSQTRQKEKLQSGGESWWQTEPNVGRVVDGIPSELDLLVPEDFKLRSEQSYFEEANTEIGFVKGQILRAMWEHKELTKASSQLLINDLRNIVPEMPQGSSCSGKKLGSWIHKRSELHDLWKAFYAETEQTKQVMWQSKLLERIGKAVCEEKMEVEFRVDRIKCLGNSVVPAQVKKAFEKLLALVVISIN